MYSLALLAVPSSNLPELFFPLLAKCNLESIRKENQCGPASTPTNPEVF